MSTIPSVLIIGNCTVDLSFMVPRFPKAGETLLAHERLTDLGGKGANQAIASSRFGARTFLAAPIGRDADGDWACMRLAAEGLPPDGILRTETATDQSILYITPDGENSIVSTHSAAALATPDWVEGVLSGVASGTIVLMQGNLSLAATETAMAFARSRGLRTVLNPAPIQYAFDTIFPVTDILILNETEAIELGGGSDAVAAAEALHQNGVETVVVTLGAKGCVTFAGREKIDTPAPRVTAIDTVGAGDVFCGTLVACLGRNAPLRVALTIAVEAASLAVTRRGTQSSFPSIGEANAILERHGVTK